MTTKKKSDTQAPTKVKKFTRNQFETLVESNAITLEKLNELHSKGVQIYPEHVFTINAVIAIAHATALGAASIVRAHKDPKSKWAREADWKEFTKVIKDAFTTDA